MGVKTKISYCDSSTNPIMGCTGCVLRKSHCYAAVLCTRYAGRKGWPKSFDQPEFFLGRLEKAIKWPDLSGTERPDEPWLNGLPRVIFVNDLSDGFCPDVDPWDWLALSIPAMHLSPHIWLLLTKWPDRMAQFFREWGKPIPSNFYLGVSVENQAATDERVLSLLQIPAAVRFVSAEPLLGPIDLRQHLGLYQEADFVTDWVDIGDGLVAMTRLGFPGWRRHDGHKLSWVIVGGESGPGARPMDPNWARDIRDQCVEAGVPFFIKQMGGHSNKRARLEDIPHDLRIREFPKNAHGDF